MLFSTVLFWFAMGSSALLLARTAGGAKQGRNLGWLVVSAVILVAGGLGYWVIPGEIGYTVGLLWGLLIVLPSLLIRRIARDALSQRYDRVQRLATVVRWLHPADGWRQMPELYRALALARAGRRDEGAAVLQRVLADPGTPPTVALTARVQLHRMRWEWNELLVWIEECARGGAGAVLLDPSVVLSRLRALGETGRLSEMLTVFSEARFRLEKYADPTFWATCRLSLFAFGGRPEALESLLTGPLAGFTEEAKAFWRATARQTAGLVPGGGQEALRALAAQTYDHDLRLAIEQRMTRELPCASVVLSDSERGLLDHLERESTSDLAYHPQATGGLRGALVTLIFIGLNLFMFAGEVALGGAENLETLFRMGALWPESVMVQGEWYRLLAAMFLHFGAAHLLMNMLALAMIGPWVEQTLGRLRYTALYLLTGLGSMGIVLALSWRGYMREEVLVGASGAIMGLIGGTGALLALGWREGSQLAWRRFRGVLLIVAIQVIFDVLTPQISFAAHASGLLLGALLALLLARRRPAARA